MIGIILYGYDKYDSEKLKSAVENILNKDVEVKSAYGLEDIVLKDIVEKNISSSFEDKDNKIMIFIGIDNKEIQEIIRNFPKNVNSPIFCGLTQHNINWKFSRLMKDLIEEDRYWKEQKSNQNRRKENEGIENDDMNRFDEKQPV